MTVKLLFFAQCADWTQKREMEISLRERTPVVDILKTLSEAKPILERTSFLKVAVNQELKDFETEISDGDEVAIMPPYSGG